jgi:phosphoribosylaminoimidazole (AIR) synthetase
MGIGMVVIVASDRAEEIVRFIRGQNQKTWLIGQVVVGRGEARVSL